MLRKVLKFNMTLYEKYGGKPWITKVIDTFYDEYVL